MNSVKPIIFNSEPWNNNDRINTLLYGESWFNENKNKIILEKTINLKNSERFSGSLFEKKFHCVVISPFKPINL